MFLWLVSPLKSEPCCLLSMCQPTVVVQSTDNRKSNCSVVEGSSPRRLDASPVVNGNLDPIPGHYLSRRAAVLIADRCVSGVSGSWWRLDVDKTMTPSEDTASGYLRHVRLWVGSWEPNGVLSSVWFTGRLDFNGSPNPLLKWDFMVLHTPDCLILKHCRI